MKGYVKDMSVDVVVFFDIHYLDMSEHVWQDKPTICEV